MGFESERKDEAQNRLRDKGEADKRLLGQMDLVSSYQANNRELKGL